MKTWHKYAIAVASGLALGAGLVAMLVCRPLVTGRNADRARADAETERASELEATLGNLRGELDSVSDALGRARATGAALEGQLTRSRSEVARLGSILDGLASSVSGSGEVAGGIADDLVGDAELARLTLEAIRRARELLEILP